MIERSLVGGGDDKTLRAELANLAEVACRDAAFAREWRNKHLAHLDLPTVLQGGASQLPETSRQAIERVLASFRQLMNLVSLHYWQAEVGFEYFLAVNDAETLAYYLGIAVTHEEGRGERLRPGRPLPGDFEP